MENDGAIDRTANRRWLVRTVAGLAIFGGIGGVGAARWASASDDDDDKDDDRDHRHGNHHDNDDKDRDDRRGRDDDDDDDRNPSRPAAPEANDEHRVEIIDEEFVPASITINAGESVTWFNLDDDEHTATGRGFDTGELDEGDWAQVQFTTPGTFPYVCQFHPEMMAEVIVLGDAATPQASPEAQASPVADGEQVEVSIVDYAFDPPILEVAVGTTVIWTNDGAAPHTVTTETFDSDIVRPGEQFEFTFTAAGTFDYDCVFHPGMSGTVRVT